MAVWPYIWPPCHARVRERAGGASARPVPAELLRLPHRLDRDAPLCRPASGQDASEDDLMGHVSISSGDLFDSGSEYVNRYSDDEEDPLLNRLLAYCCTLYIAVFCYS